jgi:serine/threonine protein kinase
MLQNVLVVDGGEAFSTLKPRRLLQSLFPDYIAAANDNHPHDGPTVVLVQQWMKMLESLSPLDQPLDLKLALEMPLAVTISEENEGSSELQDEYLCLVKAKTLRKSKAGAVQVHQMGRMQKDSTLVRLVNQFIVVKAFDVEDLALSRANPLEELVLHAKLMHAKAEGVVPLLGCLATRTKIFALFPFAPEGDLFQFLSECPTKLSEARIRTALRQMLLGIGSCHANGISHRDISLENFLKHGDELALIDFGLSAEMDPHTHLLQNRGPVGKTKYMAPELVVSAPLDVDGRKLDVWSLGVTLFMLITQTEPFHIASVSDSRYNLMVLKGQLREVLQSWGFNVSPGLMELLENMLNPNPELRPTVDEIAAHPWMNIISN